MEALPVCGRMRSVWRWLGCFALCAALLLVETPVSAQTTIIETFVIQVQVASPGDSQAVYLPLVVSGTAAGPRPGVSSVTLVPAAAEWKYWDKGTMPDAAWSTFAFDDSAWPSGPATLGYGNNNEATALGFGGDATNKYISYYFRHTFTVDDPAAFKTLDLQLLRDDGAVVYLNGQEVVRSNMAAGPVTLQTLAQDASVENQRYQYTVDPALLVAGPNVLAVEVHQAAPDSSDIAFALSLLATPKPVVRFAVIGDFGKDGIPEADVAAQLKSWQPDFVITTGDNNYNAGAAATIDANIFKHYGEFITADANTTRFFPSLGNHDWMTSGAAPYLERFALPGNERYYDFVRGNVHFFVIDSDKNEPDGISQTSVQGQWLENSLGASTALWKIVYFHHPPYSSGIHGSQEFMQWPFAQWGANAVLTGHDHHYERLFADGLPYFVNGLGGQAKRTCREPLPPDVAGKSRICYDDNYGAMLVEAGDAGLNFYFIARDAALIDTCTLPGTCN